MTLEGFLIASIACSITFLVIALAGLVVIALKIQEERHGTGCRAAGCRRRPDGKGCNRGRWAAGNAPGPFTEEE